MQPILLILKRDLDDKLSYIPLQFISEYIKNLGYDGFVYLSTVGDGENLVMFNWKEKCKIINKEEELFVQEELIKHGAIPLDKLEVGKTSSARNVTIGNYFYDFQIALMGK